MRAVVVAVAVAGCYHPHPIDGAPCAANQQCPAGQTCNLSTGSCAADDVDAGGPDADPSCRCQGDTLSCASGDTACTLGCTSLSVGARCIELAPSNGVDIALTAMVTAPITIGGDAVFDTDTGTISGSIVRDAGSGVHGDIGYAQLTTLGAPLGIFVFEQLTVEATATVRFH